MITYSMELAGVIIKANVLYESTKDFCKDYLVAEEQAQIEVTVCQEDIDFERDKSAKENVLEGIPVIDFPDYYLETLALYRKIVDRIIELDVMLFHGAVIELDGDAYLFTAKSGTGKTTHINLWRRKFGDKVRIINGDKPLLKFTEDGIVACGTPWQGKEEYGCNGKAPLKAICVIERGVKNEIAKVGMQEYVGVLLQQAYRNNNPLFMAKLMKLMSKMGDGRVGLYRLRCNMDIEACEVAYNGMQ